MTKNRQGSFVLNFRFTVWESGGVNVVDGFGLVRKRIKGVRAGHLVAALVLRTFLSLIPLLISAIGVLGFLAARKTGGEDLSGKLVRRLNLTGDLKKLLEDNLRSAQDSRKASSVIGLVSLAFSGTAVFATVSQLCNAIWQLPVRGLKDRLLGFVWIVGAILALAASALATAAVKYLPIPGLDWLIGVLGASAMGAVLFWWTQLVFTNAKLPRSSLLPGAIVGGVALAAFQLFGTFVVARLLANASALYASLAAVIALLTVLSIFAWLLVLSVVVNVVRWEHIHGTVSLAARAPAMPGGTWSQVERAGHRPKPAKASKAAEMARRAINQNFRRN